MNFHIPSWQPRLAPTLSYLKVKDKGHARITSLSRRHTFFSLRMTKAKSAYSSLPNRRPWSKKNHFAQIPYGRSLLDCGRKFFLGKNDKWSFITTWSDFFSLRTFQDSSYNLHTLVPFVGTINRCFFLCINNEICTDVRYTQYFLPMVGSWSLNDFYGKNHYGRLLEYGRKFFLAKMLPWSLISIWSFIR